MALVLKDRVKETTTTTGTGTYTLAGAVTGFEAFSEIGDGNTTYYCCTDGTDFEVGVGTYTASGTTLARTTILQSSNSDAAVNWTAGTRNIFITQPAEKAVFLNADGNLDLDGVELILDADGDTSITADTDDQIHFRSAGGDELILTTSQLRPFLDLGLSLGSTSRRYSNIYGLSANIGSGGITVSGTVDGRDVAADGTKLDGIESGATADQTDAEIKAAYENNSDTNAFTDALQTKLNGIEASADVTDATNVNAAGAAIFSTTPTANITDGTNGQVLTTNGSGGLSFTTVSGGSYGDSDVDAHLNTSTASANEVLSYNGSDYDWVAQSGGSVTLSAINSAISSGTDSMRIGDGSSAGGVLASHNTVVGDSAGAALQSGSSNNSFIGADAGSACTNADDNTYLGAQAGSTITGRGNVAVGSLSLTAGSNDLEFSVAIGNESGRYNQGDDNVFVGAFAGQGDSTLNLTGENNTAIGKSAMREATTAQYNTAVGSAAGVNLTSGQYNSLIGPLAGQLITTGSYNVVIGRYSGNSGGLDIRASDNNIVLSDGLGNIRAYFNSSGVPQFAGINYPTSDGSANQVLTTDGSGTLSFSSGTAAPQEINAITTTYTTVLSDAGKILTLNNASGFTVSFPNNNSVAYPIGTRIDFIQIGAGQITFNGLTGVTVNATPTLKMRAQHSAASCIKIATDTWQLVGDLAAS